MQDTDRAEFRELIESTAVFYRAAFAATSLSLYWQAMHDVPMPVFRAALNAHINDPVRGTFMPLPADIRRWIANAVATQDGRPSANVAWSMCPRDEATTQIVNDEIIAAWGRASEDIEAGDRTAARMTFRDAYDDAVAKARAAGIPPRWFPSWGTDPNGREPAVRAAVDDGRLTVEQARQKLPDATITNAGQALIERVQRAIGAPK